MRGVCDLVAHARNATNAIRRGPCVHSPGALRRGACVAPIIRYVAAAAVVIVAIGRARGGEVVARFRLQASLTGVSSQTINIYQVMSASMKELSNDGVTTTLFP